jgi:glyoxylase-like metal-dependent hydrolase (beta-lactamase superfamily II)
MILPLEDTAADILSKACRGLGLNAEEAAARAGISSQDAHAVLGGAFDEAPARALAPVLGLDPDRVSRIGRGLYTPAPISPVEGLLHFNTSFDDMTVNSFLVWDPATRQGVAFDTGTDCSDALEAIWAHKLTIPLLLLTHSHGDHILDLDRFVEKTGARAFIGEKEPLEGVGTFAPGRLFLLGGLVIETRSTWGHSPGGITYVVRGLSRPIAFVGDALFAGSMGGGTVSYQDALRTNREAIFSLPDDTLLCPGHGPMTTVGEQKRVNPFFS